MRFVSLPVLQRASFDLARNPRTPEPWVLAQLDGSSSHRKHHRSQERVQPRQAAKGALHKPGVVSRVPRRSRSADAGETDRNTNRTGSTHQQQQGSKTRWIGLERDRWELAQRRRIDCNWTAGHLLSGAYQREAQCLARGASGTVRPERKARPPLLNFWFRYPRMRWFPANSNSSGPTLRGSCIG